MKTPILLLIRHYNDLDNLAPLISELQSQGVRQSLLCINPRYNIFSSYLYRYITKDLGISFEYCMILNNGWRGGAVRKLTPVFQFVSSFLNFLNRKWNYEKKSLVQYIHNNGIESIIVDERYLMVDTGFEFLNIFRQVAEELKLNVFCFQTGQNPFNIDAFKNENKADYYKFRSHVSVFFPYQIDCQRDVNNGLEKSIANYRGSMRYSPNWIKKLHTIIDKQPSLPKQGIRVLMMLSKLRYGIDKELLIRTVEQLAQQEGVSLTIKPHTRGMRAEFLGKAGSVVKVDYDTPSTTLITESDLCLCMGTSMAAQVLIEGKMLGDLRYLQAESNYFQEYKVAWIIDSIDQLLSGIEMMKKGEFNRPYSNKQVEEFNRFFIYGGQEPRDIPEEIAKIILK